MRIYIYFYIELLIFIFNILFEMSTEYLYRKLIYWDVYISALIHGHESALLTVLLFIPTMLFSPKLIVVPIFIITKLFGYIYSF